MVASVWVNLEPAASADGDVSPNPPASVPASSSAVPSPSAAGGEAEPTRVMVKDGQLRVLGRPGSPHRAMVEPGPNVTVLVNGRVITGPHPVGPEDELAAEPVNQAPVSQVRVKLSEDLMRAWVVVDRQPGVRYELEDAPPTTRLVVTARVAESIPPPPITEEQVQAALQAAGVRFGIQPEAVRRALQAPSGEPVLVAEGLPAQEPVDGRIEVLFQERQPLSVDPEAQRIDLFERGAITWVEPGQVLAVLHPPVEGRPGTNVLGQTVPVRQPQRVSLRAGKGVTLTEDGRQAVAARAGRPQLVGNTVSVVPVYEVAQNADARSGHIRFAGDVHIRGDVLDGVEVEAGGEVRVGGLVSHATIRAGGSVRVGRTIVASRVEAGGGMALQDDLAAVLASLTAGVRQLVEALEQLRTELQSRQEPLEVLQGTVGGGGGQPALPSQTAVGELVKRLIERKFWELPRLARQLRASQQALRRLPRGEEVAELAVRLLVGAGPLRLSSPAELERLLGELERIQEAILAQKRQEADVVAYAVQNATVEASGRIVLLGPGAFNSRLAAGRGLEAARGVVRGGQVTVGEGQVTVKELGGPTGVATSVTILRRGRIVAQLAYPNVTIAIGSQRYTFGDGARLVRASLGADGRLQVEHLKLDPSQWPARRLAGDDEPSGSGRAGRPREEQP